MAERNQATGLSARPTIYRGTQMRSRTEAKAAAAFDRIHAWWLYEPVCYANERAQYLPDFVVDRPVTVVALGSRWECETFWEIKWRQEDAREAVPKMAVVWDGSARAPLIAWVPDTHRAYVATPDHLDMDSPAEGRMWPATVTHCARCGIVLADMILADVCGESLGCWGCKSRTLDYPVGQDVEVLRAELAKQMKSQNDEFRAGFSLVDQVAMDRYVAAYGSEWQDGRRPVAAP